jgi:sensor histidine kinase YesM
MNVYHFIFSNNPGPRISRHTAFWLACSIFFLLSYWFPTYWFPAWNTHGITSPILQGELGSFQKFSLIFMYTLLCMSFMIFFTYALIYFLLPRYLLKGKYISFTAGIFLLLLLTIIQVHFEFKYVSPSIQRYFGWSGRDPRTLTQLIQCAFDIVLFNCPTIGGIALGIKLLKRWYLKQKETVQLVTAKATAELQLLKAQVHPHFLFNTLNNIYAFTLAASPKAPEMVKKLSGLLYYIIHECNLPLVPLEKELKMIQDYMGLEKFRYAEQMDMSIDIRGNYSDKMIAPLLLIPFVENSFKHGTSKMLSKPWLNLNIIIEKDEFYFQLNNSKPEEYISPFCNGGIGLNNVQKRLQLLYPGRHTLSITEEPEHFTVLLEINLQTVTGKPFERKATKALQDYELA